MLDAYARPRACFSALASLLLARARGLAALLWLPLLLGALAPAQAEEDFLEPEQAFAFSATMAAPDTVEIHFRIAPGYYMYRERFGFSLTPPQAALGPPRFPDGQVKHDPTFDKDMEVYHDAVAVRLPVAPSSQSMVLTVTSQGCAEAGLCYAPMDSQVRLVPATGGGYTLGPADGFAAAFAGQAREPGASARAGIAALAATGDEGLAGLIADAGWVRTAGVFFLLGVLLAFTPCVLPMVPILSAIVVGDRRQGKASRLRGLGLAAAYVLGMSVVYTVMGVAAGLSGAGLAAWLQTPPVLGMFAALLAVLALAMFDVFTFQMPAGVQARLSERASAIPGGRVTGAMVMGALSALIVGPCVAAPLAGALLYISQTGDVLLGAAALFALAWGMGVPLLVVGASSSALLPRAGAWMEGVKRFFGMLLLATAWWMLTPVLPAWIQMLGWALLAAAAAVLLRAFDALPEPAGIGRVFAKGLGLMLALGAVLLTVGVASGGRDLLQPLAHLAAGRAQPAAAPAQGVAFTRVRTNAELDALLARSDRPVMLDFYADWCVSCKEMEAFTFSDPGVAGRMSRMLLVQADVTANSADDRALLSRFRLFGPPGIIFFGPGGREIDGARVIGFQDAERFTTTLDRVLAR